MPDVSILPSAAEGLRKAEERVERVAERLSRLSSPADGSVPVDVVDLSAEVVALLEARTAHAAIAKVIETGESLDRHILDILG